MAKTSTIVDIANNLGISPISVSRAIRNAGHVSQSLREKILIEADRIGYSPNSAARALRTNSSFLIGLIIPNFFSYQIDLLVTDIQTYAQQYNHGIILGLTQWGAEAEMKQLEFMLSKKVDGIIIKSQGSAKVIEKLKSIVDDGTKVVCLLDDYHCNAYSVVVDNVNGGAMAGRHLLENGHEKVAYLTYSLAKSRRYSMNHFSKERFAGFKQQYLKNGINLGEDNIIYVEAQPGTPLTSGIFNVVMERLKDITAIFTYDDYLAAGVLKILQQNNVNVPNDCSIISFDDSPAVSHWSTPPITVIKQPDNLIAFEAINIILGSPEASKATSSKNKIYTVEPELVVRESVRNIT